LKKAGNDPEKRFLPASHPHQSWNPFSAEEAEKGSSEDASYTLLVDNLDYNHRAI